jgi:uncharacterized membrane protein
VFLQLLVLPSVASFVCYQIHLGKFFIFIFIFIYTMAVVLVKEARLVVVVDDLDYGIKNVAFEANVLNRYGTFD